MTSNTDNDPGRFAEGAAPDAASGSAPDMATMVAALKTVYDPEIPVDISELGLIYDVSINGGKVYVKMTLTAPGCPVAGEMPLMVERALKTVEGVEDVDVELVWSPPWDMSMMSEAARLDLCMD